MAETRLDPCASRWRLLLDRPNDAAHNMAVDEAIMTAQAGACVPPTLRLYSWEPAALSVGRFQDVAREVDTAVCEEMEFGLVRRPTGGRAVLHRSEVTYSVHIRCDLLPGSILETYRFLSRGLVRALEELGLAPEIAGRPETGSGGRSPACFDSPSWYEVKVGGRKVVGSAQARRHGAILQHGSVLLDFDAGKQLAVMRIPNSRVRERLSAGLALTATGINAERARLGKSAVDFEQASAALILGFEKALGIELQAGGLTSAEEQMAGFLVAEKYATEAWNTHGQERENQTGGLRRCMM